MDSPLDDENQKSFWSERYRQQETGWDVGNISTPLKDYIDQLKDPSISILIPGAGNAYEAEYLHRQGFKNVFVLDISEFPLANLHNRVPDFPQEHLICENFFSHQAQYDLILEQTFFCSFYPSVENRQRYAAKMAQLLKKGGKLVGLLFQFPLKKTPDSPPYGGSAQEYRTYFEPYFDILTMQEAYNSIPPRAGNELFIRLKKK